MSCFKNGILKLKLFFNTQSRFTRNVFKLASGSAGSQIIVVFTAPLLTRLYGPDSFGLLAVFGSILAILNVVSSLRFELAITVPEEEDKAIVLVWICFGLIIITSLVAIAWLVICNNFFSHMFSKVDISQLIWLLPVGVISSGIYKTLNYWFIRQQEFSLLAQNAIRQSAFGVLASIFAAPFNSIGLILGQLVNQNVGIFCIFKNVSHVLLKHPVSFLEIRTAFQEYKEFAIFSSPAGLINVIGNQCPTLLFAYAFSSSELGEYSLSQRLFMLPATLIGSSISQVLLSKAAEFHRDGTLAPKIRNIACRLLIVGLIIVFIISSVVIPLIPYVFGHEWTGLQSITLALIPLFLAQLIVSPLSLVFMAIQKNSRELISQVVLTLVRLLPIIASIWLGIGFNHTLLIYSISCFLGYMLYLAILFFTVSPAKVSG